MDIIMLITQHNQSISDETGDANKREQYKDCSWHGTLQFMVKQHSLIAPEKGMRIVATHLTKHCSRVLQAVPFILLFMLLTL